LHKRGPTWRVQFVAISLDFELFDDPSSVSLRSKILPACRVRVSGYVARRRLFAYVYDGQGGAAVANVPLYVDAPIKPIPAPKASLPFVVYGDGMKDSPYVPSGYMGNTEAITMTLDSTDSPHAGKTCLKIEYRASDQWGGVLWQSPENDWDGVRPGGLNLNGSVACEFWARGEAGKKWDWLRADAAKTLEEQRSRRCLSHFFTASVRKAATPFVSCSACSTATNPTATPRKAS
jgi:hypothetical protein